MKNILVTGAGDRIGAAIAARLANADRRIWIHYRRNETGAASVLASIRDRGFEAEMIQADLSDAAQIEKMFCGIDRVGGSLEGLVDCAAVFFPSRLDDTNVSDWDRLFDVNVRAAWLCARAAGLRIRKTGCGWMIFFADSGAYQDWTEYGAYVLTKQAVVGLTRLLAKTYGPEVRVNSISPGLILNNGLDAAAWNRLAEKSPLKKSGSVEDILAAVEYLIGADYVTGCDLPVDGGYRLDRSRRGLKE